MKTKFRYIAITVISGILLAVGFGEVWELLVRPTASEGELMVIDQRDVRVDFSTSGTSNDTMTLLSIVEPQPASRLALPPALPDGITVDRALEIAQTVARDMDAVITEIRLNREQGVLLYRVDFSNQLRVLVDADSGQILEVNPRGSDSDERAMLRQGITSEFDILAAIGLATQRYPDTVFMEAELQEEDGILVYTIELNNELVVYIDAETGHYLFTELDGERWQSDLPNPNMAQIAPNAALSTALELFPAANVEEWELTVEGGRLVYDFELDNNTAVYVDAITGVVMQVEREMNN